MIWLNQIINILISAGIVQALFLILLLSKTKNGFSKANIWLSILLLALSVSIFHSYYLSPHFSKLFNNPFKISEPGILLISPLLWFYIQNLVNVNFQFKAKYLVHFVPYITMYILFIPFMHHAGFEEYKSFIYKHSIAATIVVWAIMFELFGYYFYKMIVVTKIHNKRVDEELSNHEGFDIVWIRYFLSLFFVVYVLLVLLFVWFLHAGSYAGFSPIISLIFSIAVFFLGYKGLFQKEFDIELVINQQNNSESNVNQVIGNHSKDYLPLIQQLINFLDKDKPYLNPELTLTLLAQQVKMSRNTLSDVINSGMNDNFYNLINRYRVEQVKEIMNDPKSKDFTILAIAFDAGFASKATFNTIFKKFTGLTPSEYRNRLR